MTRELKPWEGAYSSTWCLRAIAEKVGIPPEKKTFAEVYPNGTDKAIYRFARKRDGTRIYVHFDVPTMPE